MSKKFLYLDNVNGDLLEAEALAFEAADHIAASAGGADAGKPIILDGAGKISATMIDFSVIDHGSLAGLLDDDHTQYIREDGTRAFSGDQSMGGNKLTNLADGTAASDAVNKGQLDFATAGLQDFRESVLDKDLLTPPVSPSAGDRYLIGQPSDTATGDWAGHAGEIAEYDGAAWFFEAQPDEGTYVYVEDENTSYIFNNNTFLSGLWVVYTQATVIGGDGIEINGNTVSADLGDGLEIVAGEIAVDASVLVGLGLEEDGANNFAINFANPASEMGLELAVKAIDLSQNGTNQGSKILGADPASLDFSAATNIQGVLEDFDTELTSLQTPGEIFTVGVGGVSKGYLIRISGDNTVSAKDDILSADKGIAVAATTEAAAGSVKAVMDSKVIDGVISGATAGDPVYAGASGEPVLTAPSGNGQYVYRLGYAVNATDYLAKVEYIKRNQV